MSAPQPADTSAEARGPEESAAPKSTLPPSQEEIDAETRWEKISANLKTIGGAVLLALVIRTGLFEAFEIEGPSMEPTLLNGDRVVVSKFAFGLFLPFRDQAELTWGSPELGDVVIIKSPADGVDIVKRVIAVGGDHVEVRDDEVYRNGKKLPTLDRGRCLYGRGARFPDCRWTESRLGDKVFLTSRAMSASDPIPMTIPEAHIYVLGDHRDSSNDSRNRAVGAIPVSRVKGKALSIYWSSGPDGLRWDRMFEAVH